MEKSEVKVGRCYAAKVSGRMATVRIDAENPHGGWDATNLRTRKKVRTKSAQRLRHETRGPGEKAKPDVAATVEAVEKDDHLGSVKLPKARKRRSGASDADAVDAGPQVVSKSKKAGKATQTTPKAGRERDTGQRRGMSGGMSGLDTAARVLAETGESMGCKDMVERMLAKGLWQTTGRTPSATIYAAIIREIAAKGSEARFRKVDRGKFEAALPY